MTKTLFAKLVDFEQRTIRKVCLEFTEERITGIHPANDEAGDLPYLLPGFIDAHIHIESSMLCPAAFAHEAVKHGTIGTVSDPHEIANVLGLDGVNFMLENAATVPFYFHFGAPSCVPATTFETAGATLNAEDITQLLINPSIGYLSEMMNYPGVLFEDAEVMAKIAAAKQAGKPIDGHAPGLRGEDAKRYFAAGISTDHECFTLDEAVEKANLGVKILIREGSAARNFEALHPLLKSHPSQVMFCSDDKHPDELLLGHINKLVARAVALGYDVFDVLRAACLHPAEHYKLQSGRLRIGDSADFILVNNLRDFDVQATYIKGKAVFEHGKTSFSIPEVLPKNQFVSYHVTPASLKLEITGNKLRVIEALDGQLITKTLWQNTSALVNAENWAEQDILKLLVVNRYKKAPPAVAFIKGFGLKHAAIGGTVAHDSHNIVAVGTSDALLCQAINALMDAQGGLVFASETHTQVLPLPVAGLMSTLPCEATAELYSQLDSLCKSAGSTLRSPYMTLSFMSLLVIPQLKLSDLGLFDGGSFAFVNSFE